MQRRSFLKKGAAGVVVAGAIAAPAIAQSQPATTVRTRECLITGRNYYVSNSGGDTADGLSPATAWATLQHAYDTIRDTLDFCGKQVTVNAAHGTYAPFVARGRCTGQVSAADLLFNGDLADSWSCIINAVNGNSIYVTEDAALMIQGFSPQASGSPPFGFGIAVESGNVKLGSAGWRNCSSGFVDAAGNRSYVT